MTTKQEQLDELKQTLLHNNPCAELAASATQLVFGDGSADADVVFVGEAPGKNEDIQGVPFIGAAGKFLNEMLSSINMKREEIYITNIVKYRPPENRDPLPEEKKEFWPYLLKQLAIIRPKIIVTLGRHSGEAFIRDLHISRDHGVAKRIKVLLDSIETSMLVLPLYHPAAALYNGSLRRTLIDDFQKIPQLINQN